MKVCPACRERIKDDALRCKHCSTDLNVRKCPWCAEMIDKDAKKCKHCKSYIDKIRCSGCGKHVEIDGMRCAPCVETTIEEELIERFSQERFRLKLKNWIGMALVIGLTIFALFKVF